MTETKTGQKNSRSGHNNRKESNHHVGKSKLVGFLDSSTLMDEWFNAFYLNVFIKHGQIT